MWSFGQSNIPKWHATGFSYIEIHIYTRSKMFEIATRSPNPLDILRGIGVAEISVRMAIEGSEEVVASGTAMLSDEQIEVGAARSR